MNTWIHRFSFLALLAVALPSFGQDITGNYALTVTQDPGADDCIWQGNLNMIQNGGNPGMFSGSAAVTLVSGGGFCTDFSGSVTGNINGNALTIGVGIGGGATVTFTGMVTGPADIDGTWAGLGVTGTWAATLAPATASSIPATPFWALAGLSLMVLWLGRRQFRQLT